MAEVKEEKTIEQLKAENDALRQGLSKRNEQFMVDLDKNLTDANYPEERKIKLFNEMMTDLRDNQQAGVTARQLYGTVTEYANVVVESYVDEPVRSSNWLIALDGGLLLGSIFALIAGISMYTSSEEGQVMGIVSLIVNYVIGGIAMLIISNYTPNLDAPKGERGYGKYIGATALAMVLWRTVLTLTTALIPISINRPMAAEFYLLIGGIGLAAKLFLKKRLNIVGGVF